MNDRAAEQPPKNEEEEEEKKSDCAKEANEVVKRSASLSQSKSHLVSIYSTPADDPSLTHFIPSQSFSED